MKHLFVMLLALAAGVGLTASALTVESASNGVQRVVGTSTIGVAPISTADTQPEKPDGDGDGNGDDPPDKKPDGTGEGGTEQGGGEQGGGGEGGTPPGGSSDDSVVLTGANSYTSETNTLAGQTLESTTSDQNVILAMTNAYVTVSNCVLNKSGDTSSEDNSNFFALNAVVAAKSASKIYRHCSKVSGNEVLI